jgi:thioredoxin-like negative regulator of GroEL
MPPLPILVCLLFLASSATLHAGEPDIAVISRGERVNLEEHLVKGRWVIFDFYADWCAPCRKWTPLLEQITRQYPTNLVMHKVDIRNWGTAVALQYEIERIPYVILYNESGKRVAKGSPREILDMLRSVAKKEKWQ